jgi:hypothetical protein
MHDSLIKIIWYTNTSIILIAPLFFKYRLDNYKIADLFQGK